MILDFHGTKTQITQVPVGDCFVILDFPDPQIAVMVANTHANRFALILNAPPQGQQPPVPILVPETNIALDVLHLPNAKIYPSKSLTDCKFGSYAGGQPSLALYIDDQKAYLKAMIRGMGGITFEIVSGTQLGVDLAYLMHSKSWLIGYPRPNGDYEEIIHFTVP